MRKRGYIRPAPEFSARWVLPGYDADSEAVPPEAVVFDTKDFARPMPILTSGIITVTANIKPPVLIASWPDLGYIPVLSWAYRKNGSFTNVAQSTGNFWFELFTRATGLYAFCDAGNYPFDISYVVYYAEIN